VKFIAIRQRLARCNAGFEIIFKKISRKRFLIENKCSTFAARNLKLKIARLYTYLKF
jgi:hypothetical protein